MQVHDTSANNDGFFQIALRGEEGDYPALSDVAYFLYNVNVLYEFSRLIVDPKYEGYRFSNRSSNRHVTRILPADQLDVQSLRVQSPILLTVVLLATPVSATAIWVLSQAFEKIYNFPINRENLILTNDNLELKNEGIFLDNEIKRNELSRQSDVGDGIKLANEKMRLENEKLRRELMSSAREDASGLPESDAPFNKMLGVREASRYFSRVTSDLGNSNVQIKEVEITHLRELPSRDGAKRG